MKPVNVNVEYCGTCGHKEMYKELQDAIKKQVPTAEVSGRRGRSGSFEVEINRTLIWSKLFSSTFPRVKDIVYAVEEASMGKPVIPLQKLPLQPQHSYCAIM
ncbi:migration and invasion enhancer 1 [Cimex lectularius]|uniref:Migration and invasion enhancer 1 n=1 Tax=Cimex lectularius TaxID=79782 RepID=A0A8I6S0S2_CIMLE|nr:migration and invasion enhancer 1 [Cimex lectularius]